MSKTIWFSLGLCLGASFVEREARACGGLFCNGFQPVVQTGEHIVFAVDEQAQTVRAIINIQYSGAAPEFAWILPLQAAPSTVAVGASSLFATLDRVTGPTFTVTYAGTVGMCPAPPPGGSADTAAPSDAGAQPGVRVIASGVVGPYEQVVLAGTDPIEVQTWLTDHGYNVTDEMIRVVVPYLQKGDVLMALRLRNGASVTEIQPIDLTMPGNVACVPIRLTAIAALDDMEITVTVLSRQGRAIPSNYLHLEINLAALNWLAGANNYSGLVVRAADEAGGNAFVTEYAGPSSILGDRILPGSYDRPALEAVTDLAAYLQTLRQQGLLRGDVLPVLADFISDETFVALGTSRESFLAGTAFISVPPGVHPIDSVRATAAIWARVVAPEAAAQALFDAYPYVTRLSTFISPPEMTIDPEFEFRPELPNISNQHRATARRICQEDRNGTELVIEETNEVLFFPSEGGVDGMMEMPAARRIENLVDGTVIADNSGRIRDSIARQGRLAAPEESCACTGASAERGVGISIVVLGLLVLRRRRKG